jgi:hypothetical protein
MGKRKTADTAQIEPQNIDQGTAKTEGRLRRKIHHPLRLRHEATEKRKMWRLFRPRKYRDQNKRHGFSKEFIEREEASTTLFLLLKLLQNGLREF